MVFNDIDKKIRVTKGQMNKLWLTLVYLSDCWFCQICRIWQECKAIEIKLKIFKCTKKGHETKIYVISTNQTVGL